MSSLITPNKTEQGWIIEMPAEIAGVLGVAEGSIALLHANAGKLEIEILPPPSAELTEEV